MKKSIILIIIIACVAALLTAIYGRIQRNAEIRIQDGKPVVKIGVLYPMSGNVAIFGEAAKAALDIFQEDLKQKNGKYAYEFIFEDSRLQNAVAATNIRKLIDFDQVDAVITMITGNVTAPVADKARVLHFTASLDPQSARGDYAFNITTSTETLAKKMVAELNKHHIKRVTIVSVNNMNTSLFIDKLKELATETTIGDVYRFNTGERNFDIMLTKAMRGKPDMLLVFGFPPETDIVMRRLMEKGNTIPVSTFESFTALQDKRLAEGYWYVDAGATSPDFLKKYAGKTGKDVLNYADFMYAMMQIIENGYEKAVVAEGKIKPDAIEVARAIQENTNGMETAVGAVSIDAAGIVSTPASLKKVENGQIVRLD